MGRDNTPTPTCKFPVMLPSGLVGIEYKDQMFTLHDLITRIEALEKLVSEK